MLHSRHYTADEANLHLDAVGSIVRGIQDARERLSAAHDDTFETEFTTLAELTGGAWPGREHAEAELTIALGFDRLQQLDIVVRDLDSGLIDFPSLIEGEEVYLCWLLGEPSVGHWHAIEGGFAGRRRLD